MNMHAGRPPFRAASQPTVRPTELRTVMVCAILVDPLDIFDCIGLMLSTRPNVA